MWQGTGRAPCGTAPLASAPVLQLYCYIDCRPSEASSHGFLTSLGCQPGRHLGAPPHGPSLRPAAQMGRWAGGAADPRHTHKGNTGEATCTCNGRLPTAEASDILSRLSNCPASGPFSMQNAERSGAHIPAQPHACAYIPGGQRSARVEQSKAVDWLSWHYLQVSWGLACALRCGGMLAYTSSNIADSGGLGARCAASSA